MKWLRLEAVIAIHQIQINEHGGSDGVRDIGLLISALNRPKNFFSYGTGADLADLAASLAFGIARNHPFIDGNKRTALVAMRTFLIQNGSDLIASQKDKFVAFLSLADGSLGEHELAEWIRKNIRDLGVKNDAERS